MFVDDFSCFVDILNGRRLHALYNMMDLISFTPLLPTI